MTFTFKLVIYIYELHVT